MSIGATVRVKNNTYSVNSRLVGEKVEARVYIDYIDVWYAQRRVERLPRLRGSGKHHINYRHIIDWLVRKPGAFANYRYREDLFPSSTFRIAYDALKRQSEPIRITRHLGRVQPPARRLPVHPGLGGGDRQVASRFLVVLH